MQKFIGWFDDHLVRNVAWVFLGTAIIVGFFAHCAGEDFGANIATELASIAITVIVIDRLYQRRDERSYQRQIINQMGSHVNDAALEAVRIARENDWHSNGSLKGRAFIGASLEGANLAKADLREADLTGANLGNRKIPKYTDREFVVRQLQSGISSSSDDGTIRHTSLEEARLQGTNLKNAILDEETKLTGAQYDDRTIWPTPRFDPTRRGAVKVPDETSRKR